jgi:hypothetical protein
MIENQELVPHTNTIQNAVKAQRKINAKEGNSR